MEDPQQEVLIRELEDILEELKHNKVAVKRLLRCKEVVGNAPTRSLDIVYVKR